MTETLYSTIATIVGVWLTIVMSLYAVLFTYIINENIRYFTLLREEKGKLYSNITDKNISFSRALSNNNAFNRCYNALEGISSICNESIDKKEENLKRSISDILEFIKKIIYCYPKPDELSRFLLTEEMLTEDDGFESWLKDYRERIDYNKMKKTFAELDTYLKNIEQSKLFNIGLAINDIQSNVLEIKNKMNTLRIIDISSNKIYTLKRDYEPINIIVKITKSKLTIYSLLGTLFFGVLLPVYMLLPFHFNEVPEYMVIVVIFTVLLICYFSTLYAIKQIVNSLIRK